MDRELINILRLIRSENIGPKTFYSLIKLYGTIEEALHKAPILSVRGGRNKPIQIISEKEALEEIRNIQKFGAQLISYKSKSYPSLLRKIPAAPPVITILGNAELCHSKVIAIVGARNASANACRFAHKLAMELGGHGFTIVSGLARGIDSIAHKASLNTGTIAVLAGGIDKIYPPENQELYQAIVERGCIIAEPSIGTFPRPQNFPQRNRIISGLSIGVVVVEAANASGSLITANFAIEQGREVFAVPGSPLDPRCAGSNKLLKDGAKLVTNIDDILEEIQNITLNFEEVANTMLEFKDMNSDFTESALQEGRKKILQYLNSAPIDLYILAEMTELPYKMVVLIIVELELAGRIERHLGNKVSLIYI